VKKFIFCFGCSLFALVLTGCGSSTLICTKTGTEDGIENKETIKVNFKSDKPATAKMSMEMIFDEENKSYIDLTYSMLESSFDEIKRDGLTIDTKKTDDSIKFEMNLDFEKVEKTDELDFDIDKNETMESIKEEFENDGYKCK